MDVNRAWDFKTACEGVKLLEAVALSLSCPGKLAATGQHHSAKLMTREGEGPRKAVDSRVEEAVLQIIWTGTRKSVNMCIDLIDPGVFVNFSTNFARGLWDCCFSWFSRHSSPDGWKSPQLGFKRG